MPMFHSISYRKVGWKVSASRYLAGRFSGSISRPQGSVVGVPNNSWLK